MPNPGTGPAIFVVDRNSGYTAAVNSSGRLLVDAGSLQVSANVSGNVLYLASGQNNAQISGQTVIALISGQTVVANVTTNISGQTVYLVSGQNNVQVSGQTVRALTSGDVAQVSGQVVYLVSGQNNAQISGQTIIAKISGETVTIQGGVSVSGNVVYLVSGQNSVQISGQTVQIAGGVNVSGAAVNISGNVVYLRSGQNDVQISGQSITLVSGLNEVQLRTAGGLIAGGTMGSDGIPPGNVALMIRSHNYGYESTIDAWERVRVTESGSAGSASGTDFKLKVYFSGVPIQIQASGGFILDVTLPGDAAGNTTWFGMKTTTALHGWDAAAGRWNRLRTTESGSPASESGTDFKLKVAVSGQPVNVSGNTVVALISGQTVVANVVTNISGQTVYLTSGQNNVQVSGQNVQITGQAIVMTTSGGTALSSFVGNVGEGFTFATNNMLGNLSENYGFDEAAGRWNRLRLTASGSAASASGTQFRLIVAVSGEPVQVSGQSVRLPNDGVNNVVQISGQTVNANVSVQTNVSGNVVYLTSGQNNAQISGQTIRVQAFDPSGQTYRDLIVNQSGGNVLRVDAGAINVASNISGQVVYLVSGKNDVQMSGQQVRLQAFDPSGQTWRDLIVNQSGGNVLRADVGAINVASNISGQVIYLVSGQNNVQMSGQSVRLPNDGVNNVVSISGQTVVASVTTNISGQTVYLTSGQNSVQISGQTVQIAGGVSVSGNVIYLVSGQNNVQISGQTVTVANPSVSGNVVYLISGQNNVQISGQTVHAEVSGESIRISGQTVYLISGQNNVQTSGQMAAVSGQPIGISGQVVQISGQIVNISGQVALISGQPVDVSGETIYLTSGKNSVQISGERTRMGAFGRFTSYDVLLVPAASGGTALSSGISDLVTNKNNNLSGGFCVVGFYGDVPWIRSGETNTMKYGRGIELIWGESITIPMNNPANIRVVFPTTFSGSKVSVMSIAY